MPVPENPLAQAFLNPVMLDLPPVVDHIAEGLSDQMLGLMRDVGCAIKKLIAKVNVDGYTEEQLSDWVFETWELAHKFDIADEEIRKLPIC